MLRQEKGITLVALVITVIILIILAAVSIGVVINSNFIPLTVNATQDYAQAQNDEGKLFYNITNDLQKIESNIQSMGTGS